MKKLKEKGAQQIIYYPDKEKDEKNELQLDIDKSDNKKVLKIIAIIFVCILLFLAIIAIINITSNRVFSTVYIDGEKVSGLKKMEVVQNLKDKYDQKSAKIIYIKCDNVEKSIIPQDIEGQYDVETAAEEAFLVGRENNIISNLFDMLKTIFVKENISVDYVYNQEKLNLIVEEIKQQLPELIETSYKVEDDKVIITKGSAGVTINDEEAKNKIIEALKQNENTKLEIAVAAKMPEAIDLEKIHNEIYKEPKNASYTKEPFKVIEGEEGVDFAISMDDAQELISEDKDEYVIKLKTVSPEVSTEDIGTELCPDLLAKFTTTYIQSKLNRTSNLKLAVSKINGVVVMPGETFSYNKAVGERTVAAGFKEAGVYSGGKVVDGLGGGICQISSTLYNIVLLGNLDIVERHNHCFLPGYVGAGKDATVVWGALDFKFKNSRNYPVRIVGQVSNGYVTMWLYGTKEEVEYDVSIETTYLQTLYYKTIYEDTTSLAPGKTKAQQSGENGCKSKTYKVLKLNGKVISRDLLSSDTYSAMNTIILRGVSSGGVSAQEGKSSSSAETSSSAQSEETSEVPTTVSTTENQVSEI